VEEAAADVSVYRRKEATARVQSYVRKSLKESILELGEIWSYLDRLEDKEASAWTESEIVERLLETGEAAAWSDLGGRPLTEEAKKRLLGDLKTQSEKNKK
jgi:hypothetical protein